MTDHDRLRHLVSLYFTGVADSVREGLIGELSRLIEDEKDDARREVLDDLADIVIALQEAAAS
jgi:hypothetical protein